MTPHDSNATPVNSDAGESISGASAKGPGNHLNGAEAMVRMLEAHGVEHIFGLCGDTTLPFYDAMLRLDHSITHILTRDERHAAYMADGYARASGKVGVCEGPSGGGATYILPGLIEANESSSAVLAITTDISVSSYGKFPLTEVDQDGLMAPLTQFNTVIKRAEHIPRMVRKSFRAMSTGRPGAAHLGLPYDIQYDPVDSSDIWADRALGHFPAYPTAPHVRHIEAAIALIMSAKKPIIVCGGGVVIAGAMDRLARIAQSLDIPVATSISGKGALADNHPLSLGVVGSNGGTSETWALMEDADLVIFMGCRAGSTTTSRWSAPKAGTKIIHFDADPMAIGANYETNVVVVGDLDLSLELMEAAIESDNIKLHFGSVEKVLKAKQQKFEKFAALADRCVSPLLPENLIGALNRLLPKNSIVVSDPGTSCPYYSAYGIQHQAGRHFITNRAHGALGYAIGASVGACFARPDHKIVALLGDGSFGFSCGELETVARLNLPITFVVFSNANFGWIKASQFADKDERYYNVDFSRTDNAKIAQGFGVQAVSVSETSQLENALTNAIKHDGPFLIDVQTQPLEQANAPVMRWMG